jgi:hypothetical protein
VKDAALIRWLNDRYATQQGRAKSRNDKRGTW